MHLKLIRVLSAGYDYVNIAGARKARVPVCSNGGANSVAVAEHTLMLILAVYRKLVRLHQNVTCGRWPQGIPRTADIYELEGKTVGLVGLGNIGQQAARRVRAFDTQVICYDVIRRSPQEERASGVQYVPRVVPERLRQHRASRPRRPALMGHPGNGRSLSHRDRGGQLRESPCRKRQALVTSVARQSEPPGWRGPWDRSTLLARASGHLETPPSPQRAFCPHEASGALSAWRMVRKKPLDSSLRGGVMFRLFPMLNQCCLWR